MTLAEAKRTVPFTLLLPSGLAERARYFVGRDPAGRPVFTAVYGSALVLTEWTSGPVLFDKLLTYEGRTEYVDVGGAPGIWIEGPEHAVFYLGRIGPRPPNRGPSRRERARVAAQHSLVQARGRCEPEACAPARGLAEPK